MTETGGANKEPLDHQPVLASDGDPRGTPHCIYENALQSVTPSDVGIYLGGSNECLGAGKGWVIVAPLARPAFHHRHLKKWRPKINRWIGIDDYRFAPYRKNHWSALALFTSSD